MTQSTQTYKKRVSGVISLLLTICLISPANAENVFYCSSELATGISKRNGKWRASEFKSERYTIKFNSSFTQVEGFNDSDSDFPLTCRTPYPSVFPESLSCSGDFIFLSFNLRTLRFTLFKGSNGGYALDVTNSDTETIHAGTCQKF